MTETHHWPRGSSAPAALVIEPKTGTCFLAQSKPTWQENRREGVYQLAALVHYSRLARDRIRALGLE